MIEQFINRRNRLEACRQVMANKGSSCVDGMRGEELDVNLNRNRDVLATALINGRYKAQSILGVAIPKSNRAMARPDYWVYLQ